MIEESRRQIHVVKNKTTAGDSLLPPADFTRVGA